MNRLITIPVGFSREALHEDFDTGDIHRCVGRPTFFVRIKHAICENTKNGCKNHRGQLTVQKAYKRFWHRDHGPRVYAHEEWQMLDHKPRIERW